jgi:hypothetical protein
MQTILNNAGRLCAALVGAVVVATVTAGVLDALGCRAEMCNAAGTLLGVVVAGGVISGGR